MNFSHYGAFKLLIRQVKEASVRCETLKLHWFWLFVSEGFDWTLKEIGSQAKDATTGVMWEQCVCVCGVIFFNQESKSSGDILFDQTEDWDGVLWVPVRVLRRQKATKKSVALWSPRLGSERYRWEALFRSNLYGPGFLTLSAAAGQRSYIFHWAPSFPPTASTSYRVKLLCEQLRLHTLHLHSSSWQVVTQQLSIFPLPLRRRFHISRRLSPACQRSRLSRYSPYETCHTRRNQIVTYRTALVLK